jgi:hypothetical protein
MKTNTTTVNLIMPLEHGNGGWYGQKVLASGRLEDFLKINPVLTYLDGYYDPMFGSHLRLSYTTDANFPIYIWNHEDNRWEKSGDVVVLVGGKPLTGSELKDFLECERQLLNSAEVIDVLENR